MNSFKTIAATILAIATLTTPSMAFGVKVIDNVRINTTLTNLQSVAIPMAMRNKGCTFYEHTNGGGETWRKSVGWLADTHPSQDIYAEYVTTTGDWWNDRISSFKCDFTDQVKCTVALYEHRDKGGREVVIMGNRGLTNLTDFGFNDQASSFAIFCNLMK